MVVVGHRRGSSRLAALARELALSAAIGRMDAQGLGEVVAGGETPGRDSDLERER